MRDDAAARDKELVVAVVHDVVESVDPHKHNVGVSFQRHQARDLIGQRCGGNKSITADSFGNGRRKKDGVTANFLSSSTSGLVRRMRACAHLVQVSSDVLVLDDDQQAALGVLLPQEGNGTLVHVALLQQVLLQTEARTSSDLPIDYAENNPSRLLFF